jgi:hypothetical protein
MIARIRRIALAALTLVFTLVAAPRAGAQQTVTPLSPAHAAPAEQAAPAGPTVDRAVAGARPLARPTSAADAAGAMQSRLGLGQARALMIVGFATVIIGLMIGDDPGTLIAIAGAAVGLYGLYHYLK